MNLSNRIPSCVISSLDRLYVQAVAFESKWSFHQTLGIWFEFKGQGHGSRSQNGNAHFRGNRQDPQFARKEASAKKQTWV